MTRILGLLVFAFLCRPLCVAHAVSMRGVDVASRGTSRAAEAKRFVTVTGGVRPEFPRARQPRTLIASVRTNSNLGHVLIDFEVYDDRGARVFQAVKVVDLFANRSAVVTQTYISGPNTFKGIQSLRIGVFSSDWKRRYTWVDDAASFEVQGPNRPHISLKGRVAPDRVRPKQPVKLTAIVSTRGPGLKHLLVDIEVYRGAVKVFQWVKRGLILSGNTAMRLTTRWLVPTTVRPGIYVMKIGIFGNRWAPLYMWNGNAATIVAG